MITYIALNWVSLGRLSMAVWKNVTLPWIWNTCYGMQPWWNTNHHMEKVLIFSAKQDFDKIEKHNSMLKKVMWHARFVLKNGCRRAGPVTGAQIQIYFYSYWACLYTKSNQILHEDSHGPNKQIVTRFGKNLWWRSSKNWSRRGSFCWISSKPQVRSWQSMACLKARSLLYTILVV